MSAAALLATAPAASAQTPATTDQPTQQQTAGSPQDHLRQAKATLADVQVANLSTAAKRQVAELQRRLNTLERAVSANDQASATAQAKRSPKATAGSRGTANWATEVAAIDKILTSLLADTTTGTTGTTGTPRAKAAATVTLDDTSRAKLTEFRTHITAFASAMSGTAAKAPEPAATTMSTTMTSSATGTTGATPPTATSATPQTAAAPAPSTPAAQPNQDEARRHLTEARNTLSALTQLPAAAQLSGEARTQVSQLISNFNELITTTSDWKSAYAKVEANMTALLGPEGAAASATGTAGAVGTSGTATATLDPAVREKLVEMRKHLSEFERASSGGASAAPTGTTGTTTPPATTPPATATPPAATPPAAATSTPAPEAAAAAQAGWVQHFTAIDAILKSTDEGGGLTLDKAKVEMLRTHLAELRKLLERK